MTFPRKHFVFNWIFTGQVKITLKESGEARKGMKITAHLKTIE